MRFRDHRLQRLCAAAYIRPSIPQRFEAGALVGYCAKYGEQISCRPARRSRRVTIRTSSMPRRPISLASCLRSNFVRRSKSVIFIVHARDLSNQLLQLRAAAERREDTRD
jgi:hypothetical protein